MSLMREFLRRSALWAQQLGSDAWPFFDVAALIDPSVRADSDVVERISRSCVQQQSAVQRSCEWALHFAALEEAGRVPFQLPNPFEPLVSLFENGGGFALDGTGMIDIDADASMSKGKLDDWLRPADTPTRGRDLQTREFAKRSGRRPDTHQVRRPQSGADPGGVL
ncbi:hypothetical protein OG535_20295 [Kitasatospora sp. NBC_00085]|uniref:hypothetical protein n=1 Tax=unclassified Kitasatospora TaxID=2633591 RepID=UPI003245BB2E